MLKDERMKTVYAAVRDGVTVCDVGTDHALIPIELILSGRSESCIITDISAPSLEKGVSNAKKALCGDKIKSFCTNGTLAVPLAEKMDFIIAGMGGELIAQIIEQDKRLKNPAYRFVLQPMSRAEELRSYLASNGFEILCEVKVESQDRIYSVITAAYTGKVTQLDDAAALLGFTKAKTELEIRYAKRVIGVLKTKLNGLQSAENPDTKLIKKLTSQIDALEKTI